MGSWLATTSMGENPVINVEIWNDGTTRNGTTQLRTERIQLKDLS